MPVNKSLHEQMGEIKELIASASETLRQASWAMETLTARLAEADRPVSPPPPPQPEPLGGGPDPLPAGANGAGGEEPPALNARHLRWRRGSGT